MSPGQASPGEEAWICGYGRASQSACEAGEQREGEVPAPMSEALKMTVRELIISFRN